jgi:hypothetical protein
MQFYASTLPSSRLFLLRRRPRRPINRLLDLSRKPILRRIELAANRAVLGPVSDPLIMTTNHPLSSVEHTLEKGPPIFSPTCPTAPSGLNCLPTAPPDEMTEGS